jgi:pilus assembly protein CpaF
MQQTKQQPLFPLGQIVATPGALTALEKAGQTPTEFLTRHVRGDWGELCEEDRKENQLSLERGFRLLSSYRTNAGDASTLLSILGKFIPQDERVLAIEDTAELQLPQQNLVRFEARREQNGLPAVAIRDLLKAALRHRPDRIILGEVRGGEAFDLLQLLNTGHSGTLCTIHANSAQQSLARFTSCVLQSGVELPYRSIKTNIADSLNVVIHVERRPGRRYISQVLLVNSYDPDSDLFDYGAVFLAKQDHP